jgi:AAA family ATP:ADP antiporter
MSGEAGATPGALKARPLERVLGLISDVHPGEAGRALLMLANIFLILVAYYIIKTVREPLILTTTVPESLQAVGIAGPAEVKTYASAAQALLLMAYVPAYSWFASRVDRMKLVLGLTAFFALNILAFALAVQAGVAHVGVFFYIWVGIFSLSIIAQFWSYANDIYTKEAGDRLFPMIGLGMTMGSPLGAWIAGQMFEARFAEPAMLLVAAGLLVASAVLYVLANRESSSSSRRAAPEQPMAGKSGFSLVFASRYVLLIALLLIVLNVVNTTGEYILSDLVVTEAEQAVAANPGFDKNAFIGGFYGDYFLGVNIVAVLVQGLLASRLVKRFGLAGVLFALPIVALGAYGIVALGATLSIVRWMKTAENSADYSVMNTAKQMLWLPTRREEKYKAKQAVDSFFVRFGDLMAALVVFIGTTVLGLAAKGFAVLNVGFVILWLFLASVLVRENRRLSAERAAEAVAP